jgi:uncharacterized protein (DUF488 family)
MQNLKIYTVGYESLSIEKFIVELSKTDVKVLIDVRERAQSRKKGFSKTALSLRLSDVGVDYIHLRALGDPKEGRDAARVGDISRFKAIYSEKLLTSEAISSMSEVYDTATKTTVCLLCYERDARLCHRSMIIDALSRIRPLSVSNLVFDDREDSTPAQRQVYDPYQSIAA